MLHLGAGGSILPGATVGSELPRKLVRRCRMAVLFDDFGQFFQPVLTSAHQKVVQLAQRCSTAITAGTINWALYRKWFDAAGNRNTNNVTQVRRTINGILTRLQTTDITYKNCNGDHVHCAYGVYGNQANLHGYT